MVQNWFFLSLPVKKVNNDKFSSQIFAISSQNNVPKWCTRQHDGGPYGVSPDLAEKLAEKLGIGVELIPFEGPGVLADALNDNGMVHQIVSPISNSESKNFFNEYLLWFLFQLANWEKTCFGPIRSLFT